MYDGTIQFCPCNKIIFFENLLIANENFFLILSCSIYYSVYDLTPLPIFLEGSRCIPCIYRFAPHIQVKSSPFFSLVKDFKKRANMSYVSPVLKPFYYIISQKYMLDFLKSANNVSFVSTYKNKTECKY